MSETQYDEAFYEQQRSGSASSAARIVPWLVETFQPRRVVDIGCGVGTWAAEFMRAGVGHVVGIDGEHVDRSTLAIPERNFAATDLADERLVRLEGQHFDMSICLEVAEHLPPSRAESFIRLITSLAPVAVFGAAVPGQEGVNHVNEQWQSYWAALFARHGFIAHDIIRPRFWNADVQFWYAQNTFVYAAPHIRIEDDARMPGLDVVHPRLFVRISARVEEERRKRRVLRRLKDSVAGALPPRPRRGG